MNVIAGCGFTTLIVQATILFAAGADDQLFREKVAPALERRCVHCHGDRSPKGNLSLTTSQGRLERRRWWPGGRARQAR